MPSIPDWIPVISVGNAKLDEQHITLLELGRQLVRLLDAHPCDSKPVRDLLQDIINQSAQHNALEESILKRNACPTLREHQAIHQVSLSKLQALLQDIGAGKGDARALSQVIVDWMSHHIFEHDLPSKAYMKDPLEANDS